MEIMNGGEQITASSNGAIMEVNTRTQSVQVFGSHPTYHDTQQFNALLRDLGIPQRVVFKSSSDNCLRVIPLEDVI